MWPIVPTFTWGFVRLNFSLAIAIGLLTLFAEAAIADFAGNRCCAAGGPWSPPSGLNRRPRPYQGRALPTELGGQVLRSGRPGSNRRRSAWKADALPTELRPRDRSGHRGSGSRPITPGT